MWDDLYKFDPFLDDDLNLNAVGTAQYSILLRNKVSDFQRRN